MNSIYQESRKILKIALRYEPHLPGYKSPLQVGRSYESTYDVCFPAQLTLRLPPPPLKARGWAAMIPQRKAFKPSPEVEAFLFALWKAFNKVTANVLARKF